MFTMSPKARPSRWIALSAALLMACGGVAPEPTEPPETARLRGELRAATPDAAPAPLRLALAWYPGFLTDEGTPLSRPRSVLTQEVAYTGAFPETFTFEVVGPPPASALSPMPSGHPGRAALGVLLAYRDGNGNGRLDTIAADGTPVDHVVGASLDWAMAPAYAVAYVTEAPDDDSGLVKGFNLLELGASARVVPLQTPMAITVGEPTPSLDLFICEATWSGAGAEAPPCGLDLGDPDTGGAVSVAGEIVAREEEVQVAFTLTDEDSGAPVSDAVVTLDGQEIPFSETRGHYYSDALSPALFAEASFKALVIERADSSYEQPIEIPSLHLQAPAQVISGAAFDVTWSTSTQGATFELWLTAELPLIHAENVSGLSYRVTGVQHVGPALLTVVAKIPGEIPVTVVRSRSIEFAAEQHNPDGESDGGTGPDVDPPQQVTVGGLIELWRYHSVFRFAVATEDGAVRHAEVKVANSLTVPFNEQTGWYELEVYQPDFLFREGPVELTVTVDGTTTHRMLTAPERPVVLTPAPGTATPAGELLGVSWEPDLNATRYEVMVVFARPGLAALLATTTGTSTDLQIPEEATGLATLYVAATAVFDDPGSGFIEITTFKEMTLDFSQP